MTLAMGFSEVENPWLLVSFLVSCASIAACNIVDALVSSRNQGGAIVAALFLGCLAVVLVAMARTTRLIESNERCALKFRNATAACLAGVPEGKRGPESTPTKLTAGHRQPTADIREVYALGREHVARYTRLLSRLAPPGSRRIVSGPQLKKCARARHKVETDYSGDAARLKDVLRAAVDCASFLDVVACYGVLEAFAAAAPSPDDAFRIAVVKNRFRDPKPGYKDLNVAVVFQSGFMVELQFHVTAVKAIKATAHRSYELCRRVGLLDEADPHAFVRAKPAKVAPADAGDVALAVDGGGPADGGDAADAASAARDASAQRSAVPLGLRALLAGTRFTMAWLSCIYAVFYLDGGVNISPYFSYYGASRTVVYAVEGTGTDYGAVVPKWVWTLCLAPPWVILSVLLLRDAYRSLPVRASRALGLVFAATIPQCCLPIAAAAFLVLFVFGRKFSQRSRAAALYAKYLGVNGYYYQPKLLATQTLTVALAAAYKLPLLGAVASLVPGLEGVYWLFVGILVANALYPTVLLELPGDNNLLSASLDVGFDVFYICWFMCPIMITSLGFIGDNDARGIRDAIFPAAFLPFVSNFYPIMHVYGGTRAIESAAVERAAQRVAAQEAHPAAAAQEARPAAAAAQKDAAPDAATADWQPRYRYARPPRHVSLGSALVMILIVVGAIFRLCSRTYPFVPASTCAPCKCRGGVLRSCRRVEDGARALNIAGGLRLAISHDAKEPIKEIRARAFDGLKTLVIKFWFDGDASWQKSSFTEMAAFQNFTDLHELILVQHGATCCDFTRLPFLVRCCDVDGFDELRERTFPPFKYGECGRVKPCGDNDLNTATKQPSPAPPP